MTHGSLFSGIGGFDLAAEWMGWENVFHCEWNEFGKRVLSHYWPNAQSYDDITKTDFTIWRGRVDVLSGGFPCQPYSQAGKRLGKEDERHLWPEMLRAIRECQPTWVVGENVRGLVNWNGGLVFDEVQADLEAAGYEVLPFILPACGKDAPHRRERIWFVAFNTKCQPDGRHNTRKGCGDGMGLEGHELVETRWNESSNITRASSINAAPHTDSDGQQRSNGEHEEHTSERGINAQRDACEGYGDGFTADAGNTRLQGSQDKRNTTPSRQEQNKQLAGCLPSTWEVFPTQPPICSGNDGLPTELDGITFPKWRNESIKAYGNAVVPQVVYEIFKAIEQTHRL